MRELVSSLWAKFLGAHDRKREFTPMLALHPKHKQTHTRVYTCTHKETHTQTHTQCHEEERQKDSKKPDEWNDCCKAVFSENLDMTHHCTFELIAAMVTCTDQRQKLQHKWEGTEENTTS